MRRQMIGHRDIQRFQRLQCPRHRSVDLLPSLLQLLAPQVMLDKRGLEVPDALPQFGYGTLGGWSAMLIYVMALGTALYLRWRSKAWQRIRLG